MNYRHAFHAGGFADVIKHIVLVRMLTYLQEKQAPFRVIDTHAGAGRYDLTGDEARRGGEWLTGIARVLQARFSEDALPLVTGYLDIIRAFNAPGKLEISVCKARAVADDDAGLAAMRVAHPPPRRVGGIESFGYPADLPARDGAGILYRAGQISPQHGAKLAATRHLRRRG